MIRPNRNPLRALAASASLAVLALLSSPAEAGTFWVRGNTIYYSGFVAFDDGYRLAAIYAAAQARGVTIERVVFRNSPGGFAAGGVDMASFIERNNLTTVFQGGCYSACATAFSGGRARGMAAFDLPLLYLEYGRNILGYHGASIGGLPANAATQDYFFNLIADDLEPQLTDDARARIRQAHFELQDAGGFLRYLDPAVTNGASTIWCPTAAAWSTSTLTGCTQYTGANLYGDGIVTLPGYQTVNDILLVSGVVSGDLNPGFGTTTEDSYGVGVIGVGGVWNLDVQSEFYQTWVRGGTLNLMANGLVSPHTELFVSDGGSVNLQGGTLSVARDFYDIVRRGVAPPIQSVAVFDQTSTLSGTGRLLGQVVIAGAFEPDKIVISKIARPGAFGAPQYLPMRLTATSRTTFSVTPQTVEAAVQNIRSDYYAFQSVSFPNTTSEMWSARKFRWNVPFIISSGASLSLNFTRGFYRPGQVIPLMAGINDTSTAVLPAECALANFLCNQNEATIQQTTVPFFSGRFTSYIRAADGEVVALDPTLLSQIIRPGDDTLLGFDLLYAADADTTRLGSIPAFTNNFTSLSLVARRAFDDTSIFGNAASGDGLGQTLLAASDSANPVIEDLLGALQFSSRTAAAEASGTLRGDGYATQALTDRAIVGSLDTLQYSRVADLRSGRTEAARSVTAELVHSSAGAGEDNFAVHGADMLRYLVDGRQGSVAAPAEDDASWRGWGRAVIGQIETDASQGIAALDNDFQGALIGADRSLSGGLVLVGGSLAYLTGETDTQSKNYSDDIEVVSASLYGAIEHRLGAVTGSARVSRLSHETTRQIFNIDGLETPAQGNYSNTDVSLRIENSFDQSFANGAQVRVFAPTLSYQKTQGARLTEADGSFALNVDSEDMESVRLGAGIELSRSVAIGNGVLTPHLRLGYERELADYSTSITASFVGRSDLAFVTNSQELGRDIRRIDAGVTVLEEGRFAATVQYQGQFRGGQDQHGGFIGVSYRF